VYARIKAKPQGLTLPYKIPKEYVAFNLPADVVPVSSNEDNSNDQISPAAEGNAIFESGQELVEDSDDDHMVVLQKNPVLYWRL
jgi:hypothetical protein